jgi:hypothetical protein
MSCPHTREDSYWLYDAQGILIARVCASCKATVKARYRPEIFTGYSQADVDERIDED